MKISGYTDRVTNLNCTRGGSALRGELVVELSDPLLVDLAEFGLVAVHLQLVGIPVIQVVLNQTSVPGGLRQSNKLTVPNIL